MVLDSALPWLDDRGHRVGEDDDRREAAGVAGHVSGGGRGQQGAPAEGGDGTGRVADDGAEAEPEQGEEGSGRRRKDDGPQDAGLPERGGGGAAAREDGLAEEEGARSSGPRRRRA